MTFSAGAIRLAALAAQVLGWRPGEFWGATPAELALSLGPPASAEAPPNRVEILAMIARETNERDRDGRSD